MCMANSSLTPKLCRYAHKILKLKGSNLFLMPMLYIYCYIGHAWESLRGIITQSVTSKNVENRMVLLHCSAKTHSTKKKKEPFGRTIQSEKEGSAILLHLFYIKKISGFF